MTGEQAENLTDANRARLRQPEEGWRVVERLACLGKAGMASGIDDRFDIDVFVESVAPAK